MTCTNCANLRSHGETGAKMARLGFGGCTKQPAYVFPSLSRERECAWFVRADDARIARVKQYLGKAKVEA